MKGSLTTPIIQRIDEALQHQSTSQSVRSYLGASQLGAPCDRQLQYALWQVPVDEGRSVDGLSVRRFAMGHAFEALAIQWLQTAGFTLQTQQEQGEQYGFTALGGKLQGHIDGMITAGPSDVELNYPLLFEHKALNNASWRRLHKQGVMLAHPQYAAQIALYQAYMAEVIPCQHPAMLMATNKETAEIYIELVPFNAPLAQRTSDRAVRIITACEANENLPRIAHDPAYYQCRLCQWQQHCWQVEQGE